MKFEDLDSDFKKVCKELDIPPTTLPMRNRSAREHYSKYYDSELISLVEKKFNEEIEFGDYSFNGG